MRLAFSPCALYFRCTRICFVLPVGARGYCLSRTPTMRWHSAMRRVRAYVLVLKLRASVYCVVLHVGIHVDNVLKFNLHGQLQRILVAVALRLVRRVCCCSAARISL